MNIDEVIGTIWKESMIGIKNDAEDEKDSDFDLILKSLGKINSYGNRI